MGLPDSFVAPAGERLRTQPSADSHGYGSKALLRAGECARAIVLEQAHRRPRAAARMLVYLPALTLYLRSLPRVDVLLSDEPTGVSIREHLSLRRLGAPRFRLAQGILSLPTDFASYMRGRRRQAVRTNVRHACKLGITCHLATIPDWRRAERGLSQRAPVERWWATDAHGEIVGEALLTVDRVCALLHMLQTRQTYVRWLLHTEIVERLCTAQRALLITNSSDVPLMPPGQQHFQHLLGYSIARLRPRPIESSRLHESDIAITRLSAKPTRDRSVA
jgi:hypothetical protein